MEIHGRTRSYQTAHDDLAVASNRNWGRRGGSCLSLLAGLLLLLDTARRSRLRAVAALAAALLASGREDLVERLVEFGGHSERVGLGC